MCFMKKRGNDKRVTDLNYLPYHWPEKQLVALMTVQDTDIEPHALSLNTIELLSAAHFIQERPFFSLYQGMHHLCG